jgi:hypothetical protein
METYRIWTGTRTWLPGDTSEYKITTIVGEELGMWEDADYDAGRTYYVYRTEEGEIVVHLVNWKSGIGEPHYGSIFRFRSLEEAAQNDELRQALKDMRLI